MAKIVIHRPGGSTLTIDRQTRSNEGLRVFLHRATTGASPFVRDANQAYDIKVRRLATGADYNIRLFAASQSDAENRAKERARAAEKIPLDKYRELESKGTAVFRIVSSEVSKNQEKYSDSAGSFLRPGSHRPETRARQTPIDDTIDNYGAAFERDGKWWLTWNGEEKGPFNSRAEALQAKR